MNVSQTRQRTELMDDLISAHEAGEILNCSYRTVIRLADRGKIAGKLLSKQWVISRSSVEEYRQQIE